MPLNTSNAYGEIRVSDAAIAQVAAIAALDCYGVVGLVNNGVKDAFVDMFRKAPLYRGVKIVSSGDRIYLALQVILKYGVNIDTVVHSLRDVIRYTVEQFSSTVVEDINIVVAGIKV